MRQSHQIDILSEKHSASSCVSLNISTARTSSAYCLCTPSLTCNTAASSSLPCQTYNFSICSLSMVDVLIDIQPLILQERNRCWSHCPQMSIEYICHEPLEWLQLSFSKEARCEITVDQCMHPKQCFHQSRLFVVQNCSNLRHSDVWIHTNDAVNGLVR